MSPLLNPYIEENIIRLTVFLKNLYVQVVRRSEKMSTITLISNVGGVMGLCLGFSVLSLVEIIYYISKYLYKRVNQTAK